MNSIRQLNAALAAVLIAFGVWGYRHLPERVPTHFGLDGQPDGWGGRSVFLWFPLVGLATLLITTAATHYSLRNPRLVNIPNKKQFLELPEGEQRRVLQPMELMMNFLGTLMMLLFLVIEYAMYRGANGGDVSSLLMSSIIIVTIVMIALPLWLLIKMQKELTAAVQRQRMGGTVR